MTPTPLLAQVQEWRKEAQRLITIFGHAAAQGEAALAEEAALLAHLSAHPFNQVVQEPSVAHIEVMPGGAIEYGLAKDAYTLPEGVHRLYTRPLAASPQPVSHGSAEDANNYCRILTLLGMEEEGDPVAEVERLLAVSQPGEPDGPNGPEFTDWGRAALLSVLWHHQGDSSSVGQPLRFALGKGAHENLSEWEVEQAKKWEALPSMPTVSQPGEALPAEQPKSDKANLTAPVPSEVLLSAPAFGCATCGNKVGAQHENACAKRGHLVAAADCFVPRSQEQQRTSP